MIWQEAIGDISKYVSAHSSKEDNILREINEETARLFPEKYDMLSGHPQGLFLELISRMVKPKFVLEVGTFVGYSTICLARGITDGGRIITLEKNRAFENLIRQNLKKAGLEEKVLILFGNAIDLIPDLPYSFDLVFIDADKENYLKYVKLIEDKMNPGGILLVDNTLWGGEVLNPETKQAMAIHETNRYLASSNKWKAVLVPIRDGLTIAQFQG